MTESTVLAPPKISSAEIVEAQRSVLWDCLAPYYDQPLVLDRGRGSRVWDVEGREYLDLFGGILTTGIGHAHPRVVSAVYEGHGQTCLPMGFGGRAEHGQTSLPMPPS